MEGNGYKPVPNMDTLLELLSNTKVSPTNPHTIILVHTINVMYPCMLYSSHVTRS